MVASDHIAAYSDIFNLAYALMLLWFGRSTIPVCIATAITGGFDGLPSGFVFPPAC